MQPLRTNQTLCEDKILGRLAAAWRDHAATLQSRLGTTFDGNVMNVNERDDWQPLTAFERSFQL